MGDRIPGDGVTQSERTDREITHFSDSTIAV